MNSVVHMQWLQFATIYLLLFVVMGIMHMAKIKRTKMMFIASLRMTLQLMLAGVILTMIFEDPHPLYTWAYITAMTSFAIYRILKLNNHLNTKFKIIIACSLTGVGVFVIVFFVLFVVRQNIGNPQYIIPLGGMILGNAMNGISIGLNSFNANLKASKKKINTLLALGVHPKKIMLPIVNSSLEAALLPTMNSMLGMGIIFLPGMMTGQLLSGTLPTTAIMYQIAIIIAICAVVCMTVFCSLYLGYTTLYNKRLLFKYKTAN